MIFNNFGLFWGIFWGAIYLVFWGRNKWGFLWTQLIASLQNQIILFLQGKISGCNLNLLQTSNPQATSPGQ